MTECLICYENITEGSAYCITSCNHKFCINCINMIMSKDALIISIKNHTKCPYCRQIINSKLSFYNVKILASDVNNHPRNNVRIMSDNLCQFLGLPNGSCMYWGEIFRKINKYIMTNALYNKETKIVYPDNKLLTILHPTFNSSDQLKFCQLLGKVRHNFSSVEINTEKIIRKN